MAYYIGYIKIGKQEEGYQPLFVASYTNLYRYHREHGRRITRPYGAATVHYSYKKAS